jgi:hypothetical protein
MRMSPTVETAAVIAEHAIKMRTRLTRADAGRLGLTPTSLDGTAQ